MPVTARIGETKLESAVSCIMVWKFEFHSAASCIVFVAASNVFCKIGNRTVYHLPLPALALVLNPGRPKNSVQEEERAFTARYVRTCWARTWCTMLGKNIFAFLQDTAAGIDARTRRSAAAARIGPHTAPRNDADGQEDFDPRRLGSNTVGTADTPLAVVSPTSEVSWQEESVWGANTSNTPVWYQGSRALRYDSDESRYVAAADHDGYAAEGDGGVRG